MKKYYIISLCMILAFSLWGCQKKEETVSKNGFYFDTVIEIKIAHTDGEALLEKCFSLCADYENTFSPTLEASELYKINHRTENEMTVSDPMAELILLGLEYSRLTDGAFDITIEPVSSLWDFKSEDPVIPTEQEISEALAKVDYHKVSLKGNQLSFTDADTQIDLGAIAKGYAADQLKKYLVSEGVESGTINLGGNVLTIGAKSDGQDWNIGIQKPFDLRNTVITTIPVKDKSVVSSGVYERYFERDGKRYHHILDPKTGYPVETNLWQTTVVSDSSVQGDLISTCCVLLGEERAALFLEQFPEVTVYFVDDQGKLQTVNAYS